MEYKNRVTVKQLESMVEKFYSFLNQKGEYTLVFKNAKGKYQKGKFYRSGKWLNGPVPESGEIYITFLHANNTYCGGRATASKFSSLYNFMVYIMKDYEKNKRVISWVNEDIDYICDWDEWLSDWDALTEI